MTSRRKLPQNLDPKVIQETLTGLDANAGWRTYQCTLMTPMYGGGVEAGKVDHEMPIRASAIRGGLRYWWRITCGSSLDSKALFQREAAIWGGIGAKGAKKSQILLRVSCPKTLGKPLQSVDVLSDSALKYALGAASIDGGNGSTFLLSGYKFRLHVRLPEAMNAEFEKAFRWWASFGGVGARTRRGFGALCIKGEKDELLKPVTSDEVEGLGGRLCFLPKVEKDANKPWQAANRKLHEFRQLPEIGRRQGSSNNGRPGRSYWPEADQIRRWFPNIDTHKAEHTVRNYFPRAAFGLPIVFQFKDGRRGDTRELVPEGAARMASPLIVRPYWNGEGWQGAALLLPGWQDALHQSIEIKDRSKCAPRTWPSAESECQKIAEQISPMKTKAGTLRGADPLSAFIHYFSEGGA